MIQKTLTTYEALKANETKRVRIANGRGKWHQVGGLIDLVNSGFLNHRYFAEWEAEEPIIERWVTVDPDENLTGFYKASKPAHERARLNERVVHLREVRS